ncbi:amidohydrolase family protein [Flavobacterium sp. P21]|uniref:amidohydrolase family protein n=1 Tax=Flavobacterium sp. P21 TaxID=3423948 RepID=UPI003D670571
MTYLYGKAFLNKKGIEVLGYNKNTKYEGSLLEQDSNGNLTGLMYAKETPKAIYMTMGLTTKLTPEERINSSIQFNHELNRFGLTSVIDLAGGSQNFPADYVTSLDLAKQNKLSLRISYYLFAQQKGKELQDYEKWVAETKINKNDNLIVANGYVEEGAGENIVASAN